MHTRRWITERRWNSSAEAPPPAVGAPVAPLVMPGTSASDTARWAAMVRDLSNRFGAPKVRSWFADAAFDGRVLWCRSDFCRDHIRQHFGPALGGAITVKSDPERVRQAQLAAGQEVAE